MVAEGLASTLSETGGGKVLLVDLNRGQEAMQTYHMGRASAALPDLLQEAEDGGSSTKEDRLYVASFGRTNGDRHPTRSREFDMLIPRLKASDFDYIVFDMPPLTPTSITFRVAGFLDKVLLVAESERTHINSLKQTVALLEETNSRVALVMNKTREYMPKWLRPPQ
jgi:Mrp family chromosome partitioning ATPase